MRSKVSALALLAGAASLLIGLATASCGGRVTTGAVDDLSGDGDLAVGADGGLSDPDAPFVRANRIDILLVVDDSASMKDKAEVLARSLRALLTDVARTKDVHLGVISSSLGAMGGNMCPDAAPYNRMAHLHTTGPGGAPVPAAASGFLAYGGAPGATSDIDAFAAAAEELVRGVGEAGCGLEAQLESAYRFLVQPDPWARVTLDADGRAELVGIDATVLEQRAAFLRPDSAVVVLALTDEDDSSVDPLSVGGQGWAFASDRFPGSSVLREDGETTTAPRATSACKARPGAVECTSCAFAATCNAADPRCQAIKDDPECQSNGGYYGPTEDQLGVRFHRMKERYGVDPQFPLERYVKGLTSSRVPDRTSEHLVVSSGGRRQLGVYTGAERCTNPLFAARLPSAPRDELCDLPRGPRSRELVVFALLGGVSPHLVAGGVPAWTKILGVDPDAYDHAGIDPHMIPSVTPRPGLPSPSVTRGDNGPDPVHGREWDTGGDDLQLACTFMLPAPRACTAADPACNCASAANPPLCGAAVGEQVRAKAYPSTRPLRVAKALGSRAVVGSICPASAAEGYRETIAALTYRLKPLITR